MLKAAIKFCGGCNPRYDRGEAYRTLCSRLEGVATFETPQEGTQYDVLVILRGCTGCPYLYEDVDAHRRIILADERELSSVITEILELARHKGG